MLPAGWKFCEKNAYQNLARREDEMLPAGWTFSENKCVSKFSEMRGRDAARRLEIQNNVQNLGYI